MGYATIPVLTQSLKLVSTNSFVSTLKFTDLNFNYVTKIVHEVSLNAILKAVKQ